MDFRVNCGRRAFGIKEKGRPEMVKKPQIYWKTHLVELVEKLSAATKIGLYFAKPSCFFF